MVTYIDMNNPRVAEVNYATHFHHWLYVLACPRMYREMPRKPTREHILHLHERYLPYARSKREHVDEQGYFVFRGDEQRREELADRIRELFERWDPQELPAEITETARALLDAEGEQPPPGGWDNLTTQPDYPPEDIIMWPEGIPALLREQASNK